MIREHDDISIRRIRRRLLGWGRTHYISFPWRSETDPWLTLVAELLLQRTRATQVEPVFREFRERFPEAAALVQAGPEAAENTTARLGIHWRGPLLYGLALAARDNGGAPPEELIRLRAITGVGPYTAAAWLSLHRGHRAVIVDSNVARWLSRMTGRPYNRDPRNVRWVNELANQLTPQRSFRAYNYAVLDFTMTVCTPRGPDCRNCPIRQDCHYGLKILTQPNAAKHATGKCRNAEC